MHREFSLGPSRSNSDTENQSILNPWINIRVANSLLHCVRDRCGAQSHHRISLTQLTVNWPGKDSQWLACTSSPCTEWMWLTLVRWHTPLCHVVDFIWIDKDWLLSKGLIKKSVVDSVWFSKIIPIWNFLKSCGKVTLFSKSINWILTTWLWVAFTGFMPRHAKNLNNYQCNPVSSRSADASSSQYKNPQLKWIMKKLLRG